MLKKIYFSFFAILCGIIFINSSYSQGKITRYPPKGATFDCNFANKTEIINGIKYTCTCYGNRIECDPDSKSSTPPIHSGKGLSPSQQMALGIFGAMLQGVFSGMFDDLVSPPRPSIQNTLKKQQEEEFRKQQEIKKQALNRWLNLQAEAEANRRKDEAEKKAAGEKILAQTSIGGEGLKLEPLGGGKLTPFAWSSAKAFTAMPSTQYETSKFTKMEKLLCSAYFSKMAESAAQRVRKGQVCS